MTLYKSSTKHTAVQVAAHHHTIWQNTKMQETIWRSEAVLDLRSLKDHIQDVTLIKQLEDPLRTHRNANVDTLDKQMCEKPSTQANLNQSVHCWATN